MSLTPCPRCGGKLSSTAVRCPHCGEERSGSVACFECNARVDAKLEFCTECGAPVAKAPPPGSECPYCGARSDPASPDCPRCGERIKNKIVSFCDRCRDEYVIDAIGDTFSCPRCGKACDIAQGARMAEAIAQRKAKVRKRTRFMRPGSRAGDDSEHASAMVFAILGLLLFAPLCIVAIVQGKKGGAARTIGIVGVCLWAVGAFGWMWFLRAR